MNKEQENIYNSLKIKYTKLISAVELSKEDKKKIIFEKMNLNNKLNEKIEEIKLIKNSLENKNIAEVVKSKDMTKSNGKIDNLISQIDKVITQLND